MRVKIKLSLAVLVTFAIASVTSQEQEPVYWWLGLPSPFGGKNYNLEEIQRGEHITNKTRARAQRKFRRFGKRQAEDDDEIDLNDIDTECPRLSLCVPRFFCERFRGRTVFDQIPCLLKTGQFTGEFGICCQEEFPRKCPDVPQPPPPRQCEPRPLGQPRDHECDNVGERDRCPGQQPLCCFNGCLNVCLRDPPYSVQKAFFLREKAFVINKESSETTVNEDNFEGETFSKENEDDYEDGDYLDLINPRVKPARAPRLFDEDSDSSTTVSILLQRLLDRLRDRISNM